MANVFFKRGLLSNLPNTIVDGTVYVTTDERAMYVDVNNTRIRIGDFVEYATVDQIRAIDNPNPHALYFANDYSYLLKYDDNQREWRVLNQIQPIGNIIRYIHERASNLSSSGTEKGAQVITELWSDENNNYNKSGTVKYTTSDESKLKITGASSNASASDATQVGTVNFQVANTYDYTTLSAAVNNDGTAVTFSASSDRGGTDTNNTAVNTHFDTTEVTLKAGNGISFATGLNDAIEINAAAGIKSVNSFFDSTGKLKIELTDSSDNIISGTTTNSFVIPQIQYGETPVTSTFGSNGVTTLSVYTRTEVDNKITSAIRANDAMTFKGVVGSANLVDLPTTNVSIGDTYRVGADQSYGPTNNAQYARIGDLFIATGTEDATTGYITGTINWELIPSGDDISASYSFVYDSDNHKIRFSAGDSVLTQFEIGTGLDSSKVTNQTQVDTITIKHADISRSDTTNNSALSISNNSTGYTVVTGVTTNTQGHVTGITTNKINASDTTIANVAFNSNLSANSAATLTVTVTDSADVAKSGKVLLSSSTLQMNSASSGTGSSQVNGISMDLVWGTF